MAARYDVQKVGDAIDKYVQTQMKYYDEPECNLYNPVEGKLWEDPLWGEEAADIDVTLGKLTDRIARRGIHHGSGRDFTWIADQTNHASCLGEVIISQLDNRNSLLAEDLEIASLKWMCKEIGYSEDANGFVTPGGNPSQVVVNASIREAMNVEPSETDKLVIYLTYLLHTCVDKGVIVVGLGHCITRIIKHDENFRMDVNDLKRQIAEDKKAGLKPYLVFGSFGTPDVCSIDPMEEIAKVAHANKMWFHVDASAGAFLILEPKIKALAKGIEQADSVVIGFLQPYGANAVLFKKGKDMRASMGKSEQQKESLVWSSPIEDKAMPRGFPTWFSVNLMGVGFFRKVNTRNVELAGYAAKWLKSLPGLTVLPAASNLAVFRVAGPAAEANPKTKQLWELTRKDGRVVLPPTTVDSFLFIRMGVNGIRAQYNEVQFCLKLVGEKVAELLGEKGSKGTRPSMPKDLDWIPKFEADYKTREAELLGKPTSRVLNLLREDTFNRPDKASGRPSMKELIPSETPVDIEKLIDISRKIPLRPNPKPYSLYAGTMGMYLACVTHPNCGVKYSNPGTYELEGRMLDFLAAKVGFTRKTMGVFANDGRTGNIMPMHSARMGLLTPGPGQPKPVMYATAAAIQAFETTIACLGMVRDVVTHELKVDTSGAINAEELAKAIEADKKKSDVKPWFLAEVVTNGSIETPDRETIADLIAKNNMWHHVDMSGTEPSPLWKIDGQVTVKGCAKVDSMSLEVGSKLFQPVDIAAILVPGSDKLRKALVTPRLAQYQVDTVDTSSFAAMFEPYVISSELPKPCRVIPLWFTLNTVGTGGL